MKKISNIITALLLLLIVVPAKGQTAEEMVYSSGASVLSGILEKVTINDNGEKEVWGFTQSENGDPFGLSVVFKDANGEYYLTSTEIQDYFLFATEGDAVQVEGIFTTQVAGEILSVIPTRISCYGKVFNGTLNVCPNPASSIPVFPGLVYSFTKENSELDFLVADNRGFFYFDDGGDLELLGETYALGETVNLHGTLSQRWDLNGNIYVDILVIETAPSKIETTEAKNVLSFERDNGQVTVHSTLGINKISVYDMSGRVIFQKRYNHSAYSSTFNIDTNQSVVVSVVTENGKHFSKVVLI